MNYQKGEELTQKDAELYEHLNREKARLDKEYEDRLAKKEARKRKKAAYKEEQERLAIATEKKNEQTMKIHQIEKDRVGENDFYASGATPWTIRTRPTPEDWYYLFDLATSPQDWMDVMKEAFTHARRPNVKTIDLWTGRYKRGDASMLRVFTPTDTPVGNLEVEQAYTAFNANKKKYIDFMANLNYRAGLDATEAGYGLSVSSKRLAKRHTSRQARYHQLGEKLIHKSRLEEGFLSVYHPAGGMVKKRQKISNALMHLIKQMIYEDHFDEAKYKKLPMADKKIFDDLVKMTKLQYDTRFKLHQYKSPLDILRDEYAKITAEISIGNDNPDLRKKLKSVVVELFTNKIIGEEDFKKLINELY